MTQVRELRAMHEKVRERMDKELVDLALKEFPVGTAVKWIRTFERGSNAPVYLHGVVFRTGEYSFTLKTKSGATHSKYPWELDHDLPASGSGDANGG